MAWEMDKEEYFKLKNEGIKDSVIAKRNYITTRTLDRWKRKELIHLGINKKPKNEIYS